MAREARADRRAAVTAWVLAELHRDRRRQRRAFQLHDFLVHRWPGVDGTVAPQRPTQTPAQQHAILTSFFGALGATPEGS